MSNFVMTSKEVEKLFPEELWWDDNGEECPANKLRVVRIVARRLNLDEEKVIEMLRAATYENPLVSEGEKFWIEK